MTEKQAIECLKNRTTCVFHDPRRMAIKALEELQMYKQGGLCLIPADAYKKQCEELDAYKEIGTVEDIQEVISFIDLDDEHGIIDDLELLNKYRLLGTIEEFKDLKEKSVAKKPYIQQSERGDCFECPNCDSFIGYVVDCQDEHYQDNYCPHCGQKIEWS